MYRLIKIWLKFTSNSFQRSFANPMAAFFLVLGKIIRVAIIFAFIFFIANGARGINNYTPTQVLFFFLIFNLIDSLIQLLFREVYRFRDMVRQGTFDFVLLPPINPLFRLLLAGADPLDLIVTVLLIIYIIFFAGANLTLGFSNLVLFGFLIINAMVIATSLHIFILGLGILTTEINQIIWIYRDFNNLLRLPLNFYSEPIKFFLTYIVPLAVVMTFPAEALLGLLSFPNLVLSFMISILYLILSLKFWDFALKKYQSASS